MCRLVAIARGEQEYFDPSGIPTATEACKSNALMRCCKDLGIASELWYAFPRAVSHSHVAYGDPPGTLASSASSKPSTVSKCLQSTCPPRKSTCPRRLVFNLANRLSAGRNSGVARISPSLHILTKSSRSSCIDMLHLIYINSPLFRPPFMGDSLRASTST